MSISSNKSFNFNKGHRRAIFSLSALVMALIVYLYFNEIEPNNIVNNKQAIAKIERFIDAQDSISKTSHYNVKPKKTLPNLKIKLHPFNPNMMSTKGLLSIGLSAKQANTIQNYLAAGGEFIYKEDLKKIYCISDNDYFRLEPYILLEERPYGYKKSNYAEDEVIIPIELNTAQAEDLLSIRGIGPFIAKNIVKYRKQLGGFYAVEQLKEVYGIDSAKYAAIYLHFKLNIDSIQKLDLNKSDYYSLQRHPYLNKKLAFEISNHAKYEMPFGRVEELKELNGINDSIYQKIYHYFVVY